MCTSASMPSGVCGGVFDLAIVEQASGLCIVEVSGKGAKDAFANEAGGHRVQRVPPTERSGRVHSSTITIAVLEPPSETQLVIRPQDIEYKACRGSGAGGQNRNVTDSAVQVTHLPSGLTVRCETERSQKQNLASAIALLRARLWEAANTQATSTRAADRKQQVGAGAKADKRRTVRMQDGIVTDHVLGTKWNLKAYMRGEW